MNTDPGPMNVTEAGRLPVTITLTTDEWAAIIGAATGTAIMIRSSGMEVAADNIATALERFDVQMRRALP